MDCINICLLAYALLGSNLFIMFTSGFSNKNKIFKKSLSNKQLDTYNKIIKYRTNLYMTGLFLCSIIASIFLYLIKDSKNVNKICIFIAIVLITINFYYTIMPKNKYILEDLTNKYQIRMFLLYYINIIINL